MSDMVKYRDAIWSFLKLTVLYFTMSDIVKTKREISSNFVAFSEYMTFNYKCYSPYYIIFESAIYLYLFQRQDVVTVWLS